MANTDVVDGDNQTENHSKPCVLCMKMRPMFFVENDDMIKRLPDKYLPPFLKCLKHDFMNNASYFSLLRITSNMIQCCACHERRAHSYCLSAFVLRSQKIYCKDCYSFFRLGIRYERTFSYEQLQKAGWIVIPAILLGGAIYGLWILDRYLKT